MPLHFLTGIGNVEEAFLGGTLDLAAVVPDPQRAELILLGAPGGDEDELDVPSVSVSYSNESPMIHVPGTETFSSASIAGSTPSQPRLPAPQHTGWGS